MKAKEGEKTYDVVIVGSPNANEGYKLVGNTAYPQIAQDYERMFHVLRSLPCDYFLGAHGNYFDMETKYAQLKKGVLTSFIDPDGYLKFVTQKEQALSSGVGKTEKRWGFGVDCGHSDRDLW